MIGGEWGGGGGEGSKQIKTTALTPSSLSDFKLKSVFSKGDCDIARRKTLKTLKTFVTITSKNSSSGFNLNIVNWCKF